MNRTAPATIGFGLFLVLLLAMGSGVLKDLVALSRSDATASHVVLIPFVTLALILWEREHVFISIRLAVRDGLLLILSGAAVLLVAGLGFSSAVNQDQLSLEMAGLFVMGLGGFLFFYGPDAFRAALFPLLFLGFVVPIPTAVVDGATAALKAGSVEAVAGLFSLTGTPYLRDGFVFSLSNVAIEIADECSGIRSSIGLLLTSLLGAHTFLTRRWSKGVFLLAIFPIAVLKNGIRIVTLTLLAIHVDPSFLTGQLHHEGGVVFFVLALGMLMPILFWLRRCEAQRERVRIAVLASAGSGN